MLASLRSSFTSLFARARKTRVQEEFHALVDTTNTTFSNRLFNSFTDPETAEYLGVLNAGDYMIEKITTTSTGKTTITILTKKGRIISSIDTKITQVALQELRQTRRQSISALMINERKSKLVIVSIVSAIALIGEGVVDGFSTIITSWSTLLVIGFAALVFLDNLLLRFRAQRGIFGNTEHEAREIIAFILRNADSLDDGDGTRRIFDPEQSEESLIMEGYGVGAHA
jgi:hypothetical protein